MLGTCVLRGLMYVDLEMQDSLSSHTQNSSGLSESKGTSGVTGRSGMAEAVAFVRTLSAHMPLMSVAPKAPTAVSLSHPFLTGRTLATTTKNACLGTLCVSAGQVAGTPRGGSMSPHPCPCPSMNPARLSQALHI